MDETHEILEALGAIPGVQTVCRGWPATLESLPLIALTLAGEAPADWRDSAPYLIRREYYLRLFAHQAQAADGLLPLIHQVMTGMGYDRTLLWEEDSAQARQRVLRYQKIL